MILSNCWSVLRNLWHGAAPWRFFAWIGTILPWRVLAALGPPKMSFTVLKHEHKIMQNPLFAIQNAKDSERIYGCMWNICLVLSLDILMVLSASWQCEVSTVVVFNLSPGYDRNVSYMSLDCTNTETLVIFQTSIHVLYLLVLSVFSWVFCPVYSRCCAPPYLNISDLNV